MIQAMHWELRQAFKDSFRQTYREIAEFSATRDNPESRPASSILDEEMRKTLETLTEGDRPSYALREATAAGVAASIQHAFALLLGERTIQQLKGRNTRP